MGTDTKLAQKVVRALGGIYGEPPMDVGPGYSHCRFCHLLETFAPQHHAGCLMLYVFPDTTTVLKKI